MTKLDYTKMRAELDSILDQLQAGDIDVDEAVKLYEKGSQLTRTLEEQLVSAENKITELKVNFAE